MRANLLSTTSWKIILWNCSKTYVALSGKSKYKSLSSNYILSMALIRHRICSSEIRYKFTTIFILCLLCFSGAYDTYFNYSIYAHGEKSFQIGSIIWNNLAQERGLICLLRHTMLIIPTYVLNTFFSQSNKRMCFNDFDFDFYIRNDLL